MRVLINTIAGSRSYGLHTPQSDYDTRGIFLTEDYKKVFGLVNKEHVINSTKDDGVLWECIHFFKMLKNGNPQTLEVLYSHENNILQSDPVFIELVKNNKEKFINTNSLCNSLLGYSNGELNKTFNYHGDLGSKRKSNIDTYGYSFKNAVQCLRLLQCGIWFLEDNYYYVNIFEKSEEYGNFLFEIKSKPEKFTSSEIESFIKDKQSEFINYREKRNKENDLKFDDDLALNFLKTIYNMNEKI